VDAVALEHKYTIAASVAVALIGTYYAYHVNHSHAAEQTHPDIATNETVSPHNHSTESSLDAYETVRAADVSEQAILDGLEGSEGLLADDIEPADDYTSNLDHEDRRNTASVMVGTADQREQHTSPGKPHNPTSPERLKDVAKQTAQDINDAVFKRRHTAIRERYAEAGTPKKLSQLDKEKHMDTVAMFVRKDGSEVLVVGNIKTRTEVGRSLANMQYESDSFGWSHADKRSVVEAVRSKPEFRHAKVKIIDAIATAATPQENARRHAEMQFLSHCRQSNINHSQYVGGISKPACTSCDAGLSNQIRGLSDGIMKDSKGVDRISDNLDAYSGRKLQRYSVKDDAWVEPDSVGPTHTVASSKKRIIHNVHKDNYYSAKPELTKPNIRKATITHPVETFGRQTPKSIHKSVKKMTRAHGLVGNLIESIVEHHDRPKYAEAETLIHIEPHTYQGRCTVGAAASLHTARAQAGESVAHASAEGPNLSCGAHAGPSGVAAYANAELCRAEVGVAGLNAGVGLSAKTGVAIGPAGLSVDILGFGFSIGPKLRLAVPIADVSIGF
jgi:hypothetical protein